VYIGYHDTVTEGDFKWIDKTKSNYTHWGPTEPNNNYQGDEDCAVIESNDDSWIMNGETSWRDYPCCVPSGIDAVACQKDPKSKEPLTLVSSPFANKCGIVLSCPMIPSWRIVANSSSQLVGAVVNYTCGEGMTLSRDPHAAYSISTCNATGYWSPSFDVCQMSRKDLTERWYEPPKEAPGATAIGSIGMIIMMVELGLVVLIDLDHLKEHIIMGFMNIYLLHKYHKRRRQSRRHKHGHNGSSARGESVELV